MVTMSSPTSTRSRKFAAGLLSLALTLGLAAPAGAYSDGEVVSKIRFAGSIDSWAKIDNRHVVLSVSPRRNYLLTLKNDCHGLLWAQHVGVTTSNNTIYAGFDSITADGFQCPIQQIEQVSKATVRALKS